MGCNCGGNKLPASSKTSSDAVTAAAKVKANPSPPGYFWNGPQAKKT